MSLGQSEYVGAVILVAIVISAVVVLTQWYSYIAKASEEALNRIEKAREDIYVYIARDGIAIANRGLRASDVEYIYLQLKNRTIDVRKYEVLVKPGEEVSIPISNIGNVRRVCVETRNRNVFCSNHAVEDQPKPINPEDEYIKISSSVSRCTLIFSRLLHFNDFNSILKNYYITNCSDTSMSTRLPQVFVYLNMTSSNPARVVYRVVVGSYDSGWVQVQSLPSDVEILNRELVLSDFGFGRLVARVRLVYRFEAPRNVRDTRNVNWVYVSAYPRVVEIEVKLVNSDPGKYLLAISSRSVSTRDYGANSANYRCDVAPQDDNACYLLRALVSRTGYNSPYLYMNCVGYRLDYDLCGHEMIIASSISSWVPDSKDPAICYRGAQAIASKSFTVLSQPQRRIYTNFSYTPTPSIGELILSRYRFTVDITNANTYLLYDLCQSAGLDRVFAVYDKNGRYYYTQYCWIEARNTAQQTINLGMWYNGDTTIYVFELGRY